MKKPIITSILPRKLFAYLGRHGFFHNMDDETYLRTLYRNKQQFPRFREIKK